MDPDNEHSPDAMDEKDDEVPRLGQRFGHAGGFWKLYDEVADKKDREMSRDLNSNVDVLLIFAGLFSAVNTAFISFTMPSLSPDSSSETNSLLRLLVLRTDNNNLTAADLSSPFAVSTNSVAVNCLLYSSLCCSLLAAMGAMVGKEWLQNIDRTGQVGPFEYQAKFRQRKYNGIRQWHLEGTIQVLPNLLVISVLLFFSGLATFLFSVNKPVASVVIAFICLAIILLSSTIVAGAISPGCPYQTALSRALSIAIALTRNGIRRWREKFRRARASDSEAGSVSNSTQMSRARTLSHRSGFTGSSTAGPPLDVTHVFVGNSTPASQSSRSVNLQHAESHDELPSQGSTLSLPISILDRLNRLKEKVRHLFALAGTKAQGPNNMHARSNEDHVLNAQAACWLFGMTSDLKDRLTVAQNICNLNTEGCEAVLTYSDMWQHLLSLTFEALQSWRDQPTREARRTVELFGAALGYLLLERSPDDVKWKTVKKRFRGHIFTCRKLRLSYLEYVLTGEFHNSSSIEDTESSLKLVFLRTALHRNKTCYWSTFVCPTSGPWDDLILNTLACMVVQEFHDPSSQVPGHSLPSHSGPRSRPAGLHMKLLLGESSGADLQRNLEWGLHAFSSPKFRHQSAILDIGSAFMRRMRDFVYEDKLDSTLKEELMKSLPSLAWMIQNRISREDPNTISFFMEWVELVKVLYLSSRQEHWNERVLAALWTALEHLVSAADSLQRAAKFEPDFLLDIFKLLLLNLKSGPLKGLERHPRVIASIISRLSTVTISSRADDWLCLLSAKGGDLFKTELDRYQDVWIKNGLSVLVLAWLRSSQTKDELFHSAGILESVATSAYRNQQFIKHGFFEALIEVLVRIESRRDLFDGSWGNCQLFVLELLFSMWKKANGWLESSWLSDKLISAINPSLKRLAEKIEQGPAGGETNSIIPRFRILDTTSAPPSQQHYSRFIPFLHAIKKLRSESALIARDFDVVINRICVLLDRTHSSRGYDMYANFSPTAVCSVSKYKENYWLL